MTKGANHLTTTLKIINEQVAFAFVAIYVKQMRNLDSLYYDYAY